MALSERSLVSLLVLVLAGCAAAPPSAPSTPGTPTPAAPAPTTPAAGGAMTKASTPASTRTSSGRPCGDLDCLAFDTPRAAFEQALHGSPRVVAVGEAHAQKAMGSVESATRRFARELLPALAPRVKGIVIELLAPDRRCQAHEEQAVAERTKPVTAEQKETNQGEFVALGFEAKKLGMRAEPLIPTCDELKGVLATDNDVGALLELIRSITVRETSDFLDHQPPDAGIAVYGGLVHNDAAPSPEHEKWSFGPALRERTKESYVEIDLIVPELIRNEPPWSTLPWFSHYDAAKAARETRLYRTGPASFVLIFPRSGGTEETQGTK